MKTSGLSFWAFHGILTEMAVDWLSLPQQRLLFRSLDSNRDGRIDTEELKALVQRRGQIELLRQDGALERLYPETDGHFLGWGKSWEILDDTGKIQLRWSIVDINGYHN